VASDETFAVSELSPDWTAAPEAAVNVNIALARSRVFEKPVTATVRVSPEEVRVTF